MQSTASINLVKKRTSLLDQVLKWALSVGRLLVIITEIVAFTTFIYRFTLDRTLIDLHTKIKGEQAIIENIKDREATYRNLQERIFSASEASQKADKNVKMLNDIIEKTPTGTTFDSLSIEGNKITILANIRSVSSLSTFINFLKEYPPVSLVSITSINNQTGTDAVKVGILATLKE